MTRVKPAEAIAGLRSPGDNIAGFTRPTQCYDVAVPRPLSKITKAILVTALAASVILLAYFGPACWGYFLYTHQVRSLQRQCLNYLAPKENIVYDTDPADRQKLLALGREYRAFNDWAVFHVPAAWHDFRGSYDCPDGTAFVHERISPAGHSRLVAVDIIPFGEDSIELRGSVVNIAPRFDIKKLEVCRRSMGKPGELWTAQPNNSIRIYAGQLDPNDSSRFDIQADFGDGTKLIRCQLRDDDTITMGWE